MKDNEIIGMLKSYVSKTLVGMGALKGANCQIESIAEVTGGQKITFLWVDTNNVSHRSELTVPNGADGVGIASIGKTSTAGLVDTYTITLTDLSTHTFTVTNGAKGDTGDGIARIEKTGTEGLVDTYTITMTSGATATYTVTNGAKGDPGDDGFSPTIVEDPDNTDEIYKLDITDVNGTIVTPNLKGGGSGGTTNYEALNNKPKVNNVELTGNKSLGDLGINIPTKTSELTNDSSYVNQTTLNTTLANYTNTTALNQLLADKVDKESGKGLSANDFTNTLKDKLDGIESSAEVNKIDSISVNGVAQTISSKAVNLDVASNLITEEQWTQIQALLV
jgi:hypothetical protein